MTLSLCLAACYVLVGLFCALAWIDFAGRTHYAIFGPSTAGAVCGVALSLALVVAAWPLYWRARRYRARHSGRGAL